MEVAFINENTLGHASYLLPFVEEFRSRPELGVHPQLIQATPLPARWQRRADFTVPGLRRWGLDFHNMRWRLTVSRSVREQVDQLQRRHPLDAVVVNTQSVALALADLARTTPVLVCLDATFEQLARSAWFAPNRLSRWFLPLSMSLLRRRERVLFDTAFRLLAWSESVRQSLLSEYGLARGRIAVLPPSITLPSPRPSRRPRTARPQILFVGGDFRRKGGPVLLECFREYLADRCELHLVTHSDVPAEPGVIVHRALAPHSAAWRERWEQADVFVFPSTLETFGIVVLEALAFQVPVIATDVGTTRELLADGKAGWLLREPTSPELARAISDVLDHPGVAAAKADIGREYVGHVYDLSANTQKLAAWLIESVKSRQGLSPPIVRSAGS